MNVYATPSKDSQNNPGKVNINNEWHKDSYLQSNKTSKFIVLRSMSKNQPSAKLKIKIF